MTATSLHSLSASLMMVPLVDGSDKSVFGYEKWRLCGRSMIDVVPLKLFAHSRSRSIHPVVSTTNVHSIFLNNVDIIAKRRKIRGAMRGRVFDFRTKRYSSLLTLSVRRSKESGRIGPQHELKKIVGYLASHETEYFLTSVSQVW
ncbi:hypothetical protein Tco_0743849 [Tanacetum coccineum]